MLASIETALFSLATTLPIEAFVFIASIVEEIIAPIPSPTVMVMAGSLAQIQGYTFLGLAVLSLMGALGKTTGALVVYHISDKAEDVVMGKFGKFFNVTQDDVTKFSERLGKGRRDYVVLTVLRALPFIPSVLLSVGSGLIKVPLKIFVVSTMLGTILRDMFYLYAGYLGIEALGRVIDLSGSVEDYVEYGVVVGVLVLGLYLFFKNRSLPRL